MEGGTPSFQCETPTMRKKFKFHIESLIATIFLRICIKQIQIVFLICAIGFVAVALYSGINAVLTPVIFIGIAYTLAIDTVIWEKLRSKHNLEEESQ